MYRKVIAPQIKKSLRKTIAKMSIDMVGRDGGEDFWKDWGEILSKVAVGGLAFSMAEICRCQKACEDDYYSDFETKSMMLLNQASFNQARSYPTKDEHYVPPSKPEKSPLKLNSPYDMYKFK